MRGIVVTYTAFGKVGQVQTNAIKLRIEGVLGELVDDPKAMRGNAPPTELIVRDWFWLYVGGGVVIALIVTIAVLLFIRSRRLNRTFLVAGVTATPRRMDSASARALERLMAIEQSGVIERDDDRRSGYAEMVEVIREYLGMRYHVATLDLTSMELVKQLAKVAPGEERALIETWLEGCDLVKYGGLKTTAGDAKQTLDDARALIVTTTQIAQAGTKSRPPRVEQPSAPEPAVSIAGAAEPEPEPDSTLPMPTTAEAKPAPKQEDTL